jgi:hypothetical protein
VGHSESHHHDKHEAPAEPIPPLRLVADYTEKGHEVDITPDRNLFGMLAGLAVVLVLVAIGVWQLFIVHSDNLAVRASNRPSELVVAQQQKDTLFFSTYGKATPEEGVETIRVPVPVARRIVLEDKTRFAPAAPPAGWIHPDDITR